MRFFKHFALLLCLCYGICLTGCTPAQEQTVEKVVDKTVDSVEKTDAWIQKNMW